jgi:hypothetical protein
MPPPASDIVAALYDFASEVYRLTGKRGVLEVKVSSDVGLALGIVPGEWAEIDGVRVVADRMVKIGDETMDVAELSRRARQL